MQEQSKEKRGGPMARGVGMHRRTKVHPEEKQKAFCQTEGTIGRPSMEAFLGILRSRFLTISVHLWLISGLLVVHSWLSSGLLVVDGGLKVQTFKLFCRANATKTTRQALIGSNSQDDVPKKGFHRWMPKYEEGRIWQGRRKHKSKKLQIMN